MSAPGEGPTMVTTLPSSATAADIKAVTDRDGAVIVEQVLSPDLVARINAELDPYLVDLDPATANPRGHSGAFLPRTKRVEGLVQKSDATVEALLDERLQAWVAQVLHWAGEVQLNAAQLIEIGPGESAQMLHRDEGTWPQLAGGEHELMVSCLLAISDFTEEVGATRVALGTHLDGTLAPEALDVDADTVPAIMSSGDAIFYTGKVIHGGGANRTTDRSRRGLVMNFALGWLKPEEAQTLAVTIERARELPPRMRELCSLAAYRPHGPDVDFFTHRLNMNDPYTVLFGEER